MRWPANIPRRLTALSDRQLAMLIGALLFLVAGWPLLLLRVPPYQDLPDHMATACVLLNPARYPQFVSNGWFKANSLFMALLCLLAKNIGVLSAARVVCALVVGTTAFALPQFILSFTDRRRLVVASLVMAPMVHHWFILMGMLGFALGIPFALWMLALLARQLARPSTWRGGLLAAMGIFVWWCHAVVLLVVGLLAVVEVLIRPDRRSKARAAVVLLGPLVPAGALLLLTSKLQVTAGGHQWGRLNVAGYQTNASAIYALWAHEFFGLSPLSASSLVLALTIGLWAAKRCRGSIPMFSSWAVVALGAAYWFLPETLPAFGYVNERAIPFLWLWALVRVPPRVPWCVTLLLAACSLGWSAGLGVDLLRAQSDLNAFIAAAPLVPEGARLLTLNFEPRVSSRNTASLLHASGMYTVLRAVKPQDVWADSPAMPIRYATAPDFVQDPLAIREFLEAAATPKLYCETLSRVGVPATDCSLGWSAIWSKAWREVASRYELVLLWGAPTEFTEAVPAPFSMKWSQGQLRLLVRNAETEP